MHQLRSLEQEKLARGFAVVADEIRKLSSTTELVNGIDVNVKNFYSFVFSCTFIL